MQCQGVHRPQGTGGGGRLGACAEQGSERGGAGRGDEAFHDNSSLVGRDGGISPGGGWTLARPPPGRSKDAVHRHPRRALCRKRRGLETGSYSRRPWCETGWSA
ncbi:hypothetical protein AH4AK4_2032 [Aeromonas hydrophila 4AK4]|nr:hypothetical protein AH4AK4_2032 [Aeromonas hydrophila 4AK4]